MAWSPRPAVNEAVDTYLANRIDDARNGIGRANPRSVKIYRSVAENWIKPILAECGYVRMAAAHAIRGA